MTPVVKTESVMGKPWRTYITGKHAEGRIEWRSLVVDKTLARVNWPSIGPVPPDVAIQFAEDMIAVAEEVKRIAAAGAPDGD